jgi:hypothetical protein
MTPDKNAANVIRGCGKAYAHLEVCKGSSGDLPPGRFQLHDGGLGSHCRGRPATAGVIESEQEPKSAPLTS